MKRLLRPSTGRQMLVLALDGAIGATSVWLAMLLRFEGPPPEPYASHLPTLVLLVATCRVLATYACRLHQWSFRFSGLTDAVRVGLGGVVGTGLFASMILLLSHPVPPRSVIVIELLVSWLMMAAARFTPRLAEMYVRDWVRSRREGSLRTLIVGAGSAGESLLRDLQRSHQHAYQVAGFVDDDPAKHGQIVGGKTVLGSIADLPGLVAQHRIQQVLIAIPRLEPRRIREILSLSSELKLRFKILPYSIACLDNAAASMVQDLEPEDLLQREPVTFTDADASYSLAARSALVTGAAGSIGSEISRQLLRAGLGRLVLADVDENGLYLLARRLERDHPNAEIAAEIADVRDAGRVRELFERYRPSDVFHAAAHKHVPLLEGAPCDAVKNNVGGTRNVVELADVFGAERFVFISTDKAVRPTSVMGATKRLGEEIVRDRDRRSATRFCAVRFGNVLGSAGSVLPIFREQIAAGGPVTVTHPDVTRYFMTIPEAVALVLQAAYAGHGALCVLNMGEPIRILELARHVITLSGRVPEVDVPITYTGLRPGEKLHEELLADGEERLRSVDSRILVADCPPPRPDLAEWVDVLLEAASARRTEEVIELLTALVPGYRSSERPARAAVASPAHSSVSARAAH